MNSVAIVGLGWLGFPLAKHLIRTGWDVSGSKRTREGAESMRLNGINAYYLELTPEVSAEPDTLNRLLDVDSLVINIPPSQYFFDTESYISGVENLVNEALLAGVQHFIFISSTSVFPQKSGVFDENSLVEPDAEIGMALYNIEQYLLSMDDINCDVLRLAGLVGNDRHPVKYFTGRDDLNQGNQPVNLVHRLDVVLAIQLLLDTQGGKRLYHLSAPYHPPKGEYYPKIAELLELPQPLFQSTDNDIQRIIKGNKICDELDFEYRFADPYSMLPSEEKQYFHSDD